MEEEEEKEKVGDDKQGEEGEKQLILLSHLLFFQFWLLQSMGAFVVHIKSSSRQRNTTAQYNLKTLI